MVHWSESQGYSPTKALQQVHEAEPSIPMELIERAPEDVKVSLIPSLKLMR